MAVNDLLAVSDAASAFAPPLLALPDVGMPAGDSPVDPPRSTTPQRPGALALPNGGPLGRGLAAIPVARALWPDPEAHVMAIGQRAGDPRGLDSSTNRRQKSKTRTTCFIWTWHLQFVRLNLESSGG